MHYHIGPGIQFHNPNPFWYWLWFVPFGGGFILLKIILGPGSCGDFQNEDISWFTSDPFCQPDLETLGQETTGNTGIQLSPLAS